MIALAIYDMSHSRGGRSLSWRLKGFRVDEDFAISLGS